jgi:SAM-dependent methyltransferase
MNDIAGHYSLGDPVRKLRQALEQLAPGGRRLALEELGGFDDFHTAGRMATQRLAEWLAPKAGELVLDAGSGIGGPARYLIDTTGCRVIGFDLTPEFVEAARVLNERTGFGDRFEVRLGDITRLDLADASVDHVWTQHVAMNIRDRDKLYAETRRVMKRGGRFALFDVVDGGGGELLVPVPWATTREHSHLLTPVDLRKVLEKSGFTIDKLEEPTAEMLELTRRMLAAPPPGSPPPVLSPRLFMHDIEIKAKNYLANITDGRTALVMALCTAA